MRRELQPKSAASRRIVAAKARSAARRHSLAGGAKKPGQPQPPQLEEFPLAHDAATWDEDTFESGWDDDEARIAGELAPNDDD